MLLILILKTNLKWLDENKTNVNKVKKTRKLII